MVDVAQMWQDRWHASEAKNASLREINAEMLEALEHARDNSSHPDQMIDEAIAKAGGAT